MAEPKAEKREINQAIGESLKNDLKDLNNRIAGEVYFDHSTRLQYATDASAYRELPLAVCRPHSEADIIALVQFAKVQKITLIPRAAGTSLAGQVVGRGLVVDVSRHMTQILEIDVENRLVKVQPGVILDELNLALKPYGLFFSPETSTSNRCMIGGMIGNNSSGLHSVVYGTTREHLESLRMVLSDGTVSEFGNLEDKAIDDRVSGEGISLVESGVYALIDRLFKDPVNLEAIDAEFPHPGVVRRNTGYALDELSQCQRYRKGDAKHRQLNLCRLIAGSEGTLGIITEAVLSLDPLPPEHKALVPVHVDSVMDAIRGNLIALAHDPAAVELMDRTILRLTEGNLGQQPNRFFLKGDPGAILIVEFVGASMDAIRTKAQKMEQVFRAKGIGFHFPFITGGDIKKVWSLRKAGLGVLSRMEGDAKPVSVIEDTSVVPTMLEDYITEFNLLLEEYDLECVYHAHISVGELHLRPVLDLKDPKDVKLFKEIAERSARLVKKFRGSLSGEHGDGRLRGEFIPIMVGARNFEMMRQIKHAFDPSGVFNAGKIFDAPPMNTFLRYPPGTKTPQLPTYFDFNSNGGMLRHIEQCNGSGDCRKTELAGGAMCPSYMATREESTTTRARANILREFIGKPGRKGTFDHQEVYDILDLCLSCKACKAECPSSVDMAKLKSEFLQHWYDHHGVPMRSRLIANIVRISWLGMIWPAFYNLLVNRSFIGKWVKRFSGIAPERSFPELHRETLRKWCTWHLKKLNDALPGNAPEVVYFVDEFTNYNDVPVGIAAIKLLNRLGIRAFVVHHDQSGRAYLSKGFLRKARKIARRNVMLLKDSVHENRPLVGTEPSAILSFRDEYPELVGPEFKEDATYLSKHSMLFEEYIMKLKGEGAVDQHLFTTEEMEILLHGHCQQKAVASTAATLEMLSLPSNYHVREIPSGCCGMAGSFGYEKEHYDLSQRVGELVLFPAVREAKEATEIAIPGTSCRHQVKDGTGKTGKHPVEILFEALA